MWICIIKRRGGFAVERVFERWTQTRRRKKNGQNYEKNAPYFIEQLSRLHIEINSHCDGEANARVNTVENLTRATNLCKCVNGYCTVFCLLLFSLSLFAMFAILVCRAGIGLQQPPKKMLSDTKNAYSDYTYIHTCVSGFVGLLARAREKVTIIEQILCTIRWLLYVYTHCALVFTRIPWVVFFCRITKKTTNHCAV